MFCAQIFDIYCWPEKLPFSDGLKMEVVCLTIFDPFIFGIPVILTGVLLHGFYGVIQEDVSMSALMIRLRLILLAKEGLGGGNKFRDVLSEEYFIPYQASRSSILL